MLRTALIGLSLALTPSPLTPATSRSKTNGAAHPQQSWFHPARSPCPAIAYDPKDAQSLTTARTACNATDSALQWGACVSKQGDNLPTCAD